MRIYLINLERRPDRLAAMTARAEGLGLALERIEAVDAATAEPDALDRWFEDGGPLGEIPRGDNATAGEGLLFDPAPQRLIHAAMIP